MPFSERWVLAIDDIKRRGGEAARGLLKQEEETPARTVDMRRLGVGGPDQSIMPSDVE